MSRTPASEAPALTPELMLQKASLARSSGLRAKYAQRGLAHAGEVDPTTQTLLLRQLYLSHLERRRFAEALVIAEQMLAMDVMPDVVRQDAARACLGMGDIDRAVEHLRLASRCAPASRRSFHLWTLGSVLYLHDRAAEAAHAFERAARWGTTDRPLYRAQLALAQLALAQVAPAPGAAAHVAPSHGAPTHVAPTHGAPGEPGRARRVTTPPPADAPCLQTLGAAADALAGAPCGQGYGEFVRGELAAALGRREEAISLLETFVDRVAHGRVALAVALAPETRRARALLGRLRRRRR